MPTSAGVRACPPTPEWRRPECRMSRCQFPNVRHRPVRRGRGCAAAARAPTGRHSEPTLHRVTSSRTPPTP